MFIDWQRIQQENSESDSTIDELMRQAARSLETGKITEEDIVCSLVEDRDWDPGEAFNLARAARILAVKK